MNVIFTKSIRRILLKGMAVLSALVFALYLGVWAFSPLVFQSLLRDQLQQVGLVLSEDSHIRYNPFLSRIDLRDFTLAKGVKKPLIIHSAKLEVDLHTGAWGDLRIRSFEIEGVNIVISNIDGKLAVAGVDLPASTAVDELEEKAQKRSEAIQKGVVLPELVLLDSSVTYIDEVGRSEVLHIQSLRILDGKLYQSSQMLKIEFKGGFHESQISINADLNIIGDNQSISTDIDIRGLDVSFVQDYFPEGLELSSGELDLHFNPVLNIDKESVGVGITDLELKLGKLFVRQGEVITEIKEKALLEVKNLQFKNQSLSIENIFIDSLHAAIAIDSRIERAVDVKAGNDSKDVNIVELPQSKELKSNTEEAEELVINIRQFAFRGDNSIAFNDNSVTPKYERVFHIDKAEITDLNSQEKNNSPFVFKGRSNEYAKIDLSGFVSPFSEEVNLKVGGTLTEMSLPAISSYIKNAIGFELKTGQLDTEIDVTVNDSIIDGGVGLHLRGLKLETADTELKTNMEGQTAVPLNLALGMLQDKQGNVKLNVPVSGSVDDPDFGMSSFMMLITKKAIMSSAKSFLMKTFVPYSSVVSVAMSATDHILKLRFEDLPYDPTEVKVGPNQQQYVNQFIALMKEKQKAQVKICAITTPLDISLTFPAILSDAQILSLQEIAKQRAENFKSTVVQSGGIDSSRLLLCSPKVELKEGSISRVEISI